VLKMAQGTTTVFEFLICVQLKVTVSILGMPIITEGSDFAAPFCMCQDPNVPVLYSFCLIPIYHQLVSTRVSPHLLHWDLLSPS
jgi:hypothetical protein